MPRSGNLHINNPNDYRKNYNLILIHNMVCWYLPPFHNRKAIKSYLSVGYPLFSQDRIQNGLDSKFYMKIQFGPDKKYYPEINSLYQNQVRSEERAVGK